MTLASGGPLLLVGAGKMGGALLAGWLEGGVPPERVLVQDPSPAPEAAALIGRYGLHVAARVRPAEPPAAIVLAVKPQIMDAVLPPLAPLMGSDTVALSIAAGRTLASLAIHLGRDAALVRAMPNTPAAIGRGMTVACAGGTVTPSQRQDCTQLLEAVGEVAWVEDEALLDPVTAVSGSGPAYVFLLTEYLAKAGVEAGLDAALAARLARATVAGAGELMLRSGIDAAELRRNVTSQGGTTEAALEVLMGETGMAEPLARAVAAAARRSKALSS